MVYYFFRRPNATTTPPRTKSESAEGSGMMEKLSRVNWPELMAVSLV